MSALGSFNERNQGELRFVNPCGPTEPFSGSDKDVFWPTSLEGLRVGFLGNGKSNVAAFLKQVSLLLSSKGVTTTCFLAKEGPMSDCGEARYQQLQDQCDVVVVGVSDGGTAASTGAIDAATLGYRGTPSILICTDAFAPLAEVTLPADIQAVRIIVVPHPLSSLTNEQTIALAQSSFDDVLAAITSDGGKSSPHGKEPLSQSVISISDAEVVTAPVSDDLEGSKLLYELGFSDGLPAHLPTLDRVNALLNDWRLDNRLSAPPLIHPRRGLATPEAMAANAVITGLPARSMPYLAATLEAAAHPRFKLFNLQTTTNPVTPVVVVGGPSRRKMGFNDGLGSIGAGNLSNATLGRALKLCMRNIGGARYEDGTDPATMGQPGKYAFCFAENEDYTSWPRLREQTHHTRLSSSDDAITLIGVTGTMNMIIKSTSAEELLQMIAKSINSIGSNDYMFGGNPLLVLCPEHAEIFEREKVSLHSVQRVLFDLTKIPFSEFAPKNQEMMRTPRFADLGELHMDTDIPLAKSPEDILVCVTGGPSLHSTFMPSFGGSTPVSAKVLTQ